MKHITILFTIIILSTSCVTKRVAERRIISYVERWPELKTLTVKEVEVEVPGVELTPEIQFVVDSARIDSMLINFARQYNDLKDDNDELKSFTQQLVAKARNDVTQSNKESFARAVLEASTDSLELSLTWNGNKAVILAKTTPRVIKVEVPTQVIEPKNCPPRWKDPWFVAMVVISVVCVAFVFKKK